jgi:hypothetical protein
MQRTVLSSGDDAESKLLAIYSDILEEDSHHPESNEKIYRRIEGEKNMAMMYGHIKESCEKSDEKAYKHILIAEEFFEKLVGNTYEEKMKNMNLKNRLDELKDAYEKRL